MYNIIMENKIRLILQQNKGKYVSGQDMSDALFVSRMTISSEIKKLKQQGYDIITSTKKGYCLTDQTDMIILSQIKESIDSHINNVLYFETLDSTSTYITTHQEDVGTLVIAEEQTQGKGRQNKPFLSQKFKGIYMSFVIDPQLDIHKSLKMTACSALALVKTIEKYYDVKPSIKWVNDIYIGDLKIAGILCEATLDLNTSLINRMVIGIGLNVFEQDFKQFDSIATSLESITHTKVSREKLIIEFFDQFFNEFARIDDPSLMDDYRHYSNILHQHITVYQNNTSYDAYVEHINDDGSLLIQANNQSIILNSGEITIRKVTPQRT